jgi:hypothetical protein
MPVTAWRLENVEARHREEPRAYSIPRLEERRALVPGQLVKLVFVVDPPIGEFDGERMWVEVLEGAGGRFVGALDNDPELVGGLERGDRVPFSVEHVAAIFVEPGWIDPTAPAIVSRRVIEDDAWPGRLVQQGPTAAYSGWQIFVGDEPPNYLAQADNAWLCPLGELVERFPVLDSVLGEDAPGEWRWDADAAEYRRV